MPAELEPTRSAGTQASGGQMIESCRRTGYMYTLTTFSLAGVGQLLRKSEEDFGQMQASIRDRNDITLKTLLMRQKYTS